MNAIDTPMQSRYPGGYQWFEADTIVKPELTLGGAPTPASAAASDFALSTGRSVGTYESESYPPPQNLFLLFAETPSTREGIKRFADQFGLLGLNQSDGGVMLALGSSDRDSRERVLSVGERFSAWQSEIQAMRQGVGLWSALREAQSGDLSKLSSQIRWLRNDFVYYDSHMDYPIPPEAWCLGIPGAVQRRIAHRRDDLRTFAVIASKEHNPEWFKRFPVGDCLRPAQYYLQKIINERLQTRVSPQLLWHMRGGHPDKLGLFFVPRNLLGVMWLQLAEAVNGNRGYRQCATCKTWMAPSRESSGYRSSRFTCSDACRMKVYYGRIVAARRLARQGVSIPKIAQRLNTTSQKVHGWIDRRPRRLEGSSRKQRKTR